jgi:hypothetical protein
MDIIILFVETQAPVASIDVTVRCAVSLAV